MLQLCMWHMRNERARSLISLLLVKNRQFFFAIELMSNFINSIEKKFEFCIFSTNFWWFFSGFRAKFQKIVTCVAFSINFARTNQKFAENSEFCENYSLLFKIIHWCPFSPSSTQSTASYRSHISNVQLEVVSIAKYMFDFFEEDDRKIRRRKNPNGRRTIW